MSRPDDPTPRATQGTQRGRRADQHYHQDSMGARQSPPPEQWHANEPYHYPGQQRGEHPQMFSDPPPMPRTAPQQPDPRSSRPRQQDAQRPEYAPQFARYQYQRPGPAPDAYSPPQSQRSPQPAPQHHADQAEGQYWPQHGERFDPRAPQQQPHARPQHAEDTYHAPGMAHHGQPQEPPMVADDYDDRRGGYDDQNELRADHEPEGEDYEEEFEDERPPRRRGLIYAAAFLSAIAIGAGAAVGYKLLFSDKGSLNARQISNITSPKTPTKAPAPESKTVAELKKEAVRPSDTMTAPQQPPPAITTTDTTAPTTPAPRVPGLIVQRPPSPPAIKEEPPVATETQPSQPTTKMVKTVPITKDGVPVVPPVEPPQNKSVEVVSTKATAPKNIELADQTPPVPPARLQAPPKAPTQKTQVAVAPPQPPVETDATETPIQKKQRPAIPKPPVERKQPTTTASTTSGFVPVLSSQKSRGDALRAFADLQQKYPAILSDKQPEVQAADLDSGHWERLVVGPPASQEAAKDVCAKLTAAGYKGCWVKPY